MRHLIDRPKESGTAASPLDGLTRALRQTGVCKLFERLDCQFHDAHLKDLTTEETRPGRLVRLAGRWVVNFGSDSFLGLDEDPRLHEAVRRGLERWGTHNGTSRMFSSVAANVEAEEKLARWLGVEAVLIYPSATLANHGALPALLTRHDVAVADQHAHNSVREGLELAAAHGTRTATFAHDDADDLERVLRGLRPYRYALVAVDGVYSMSGSLARLSELNAVARKHNAVLYVDDAHGTGVIGPQGRGTVPEVLGSYDNVLTVGSLSKALSAAGGYVAGTAVVQRLLKMRSSSFIFGGPVPPPYLEAVSAAVDVIASDEYGPLRRRLEENKERLACGARALGLTVSGGVSPIISILIGDEDRTMLAGRFLFDRGYYVQSVAFPAVPYHAGVLRIQANANHTPAQVEGLLGALGEMSREFAPALKAKRA
jgi:7-keto-8-aminopelargonate synthetase-like enzyme